MIPIKTFFRGAFWLNIILFPLHAFIIFIFLVAQPSVETLIGMLARLAGSILFLLGSQIGILLLMSSIAKIVDRMMYKIPFSIQEITYKALIISLIVSIFTITTFCNIYIDNLFQFKQENYVLVCMPLWVLFLYYCVCFVLGKIINRPKCLR